MASQGAVAAHNGYPNARPFLLMEGGPLYRIEKRVGLIKENAPYIIREATFAAALTWFPLLILSALQGTAAGRHVPVSFLKDFSAYTRFLLALPLLLLAEIVLGPRIAEAAEHFVLSGVVGEDDFEKFDDLIGDGLRLRDSVIAEIIMIALSYIISIVAFRITAVRAVTWYATPAGDRMALTLAGWWLILFCTPLLQFVTLRWLWRVFLWFLFLARVCHLNLHLFPTHPDEAAGIGFVGETQRFFGILLFAYSIGITGVIANQVVYGKVPLTTFGPAIAVYVVICLGILLLPLAIFTPTLLITKKAGLYKYGTLATDYTGSFDRKWIRGIKTGEEGLLGTGDIQSLADLGNSYAYIQRMNMLPLHPRTLFHLLVAAILPMVPLVLTVMPLKDVLHLLLKVFM